MFKEATLMNEFIDKETPVAGPVVNEVEHGSSTFSTGQVALVGSLAPSICRITSPVRSGLRGIHPSYSFVAEPQGNGFLSPSQAREKWYAALIVRDAA
jgi:hypothetical protein